MKPFLISIASLCGIFLFLVVSNGLGFGMEALFGEHLVVWILFGIFWLLGGALWETTDQNTKFFKKLLIIAEVYLFLLIFVQPGINLSWLEFLVLYGAGYGIVYEVMTFRAQKWQTVFFSSCYGVIVALMVSIAALMWWRQPFDEEQFITQQWSFLFTVFDGTLVPSYTTILLKSPMSEKVISASTKSQTFLLDKNTDYLLQFASQQEEEHNFIVLQDQEGNLIKVGPQSQLRFSTHASNFSLQEQKGRVAFFGTGELLPPELMEFRDRYQAREKAAALALLPAGLKSNPTFQRWSIRFTSSLAKVFPFWYGENAKYIESYLPYLGLSATQKQHGKVDYSILKSTWKLWTEKANHKEKYREYFKKLF